MWLYLCVTNLNYFNSSDTYDGHGWLLSAILKPEWVPVEERAQLEGCFCLWSLPAEKCHARTAFCLSWNHSIGLRLAYNACEFALPSTPLVGTQSGVCGRAVFQVLKSYWWRHFLIKHMARRGKRDEILICLCIFGIKWWQTGDSGLDPSSLGLGRNRGQEVWQSEQRKNFRKRIH